MKKMIMAVLMLVACAVGAVDLWESRLATSVTTLIQTNHNTTPGTVLMLPDPMREIRVWAQYVGGPATSNGWLRFRVIAAGDSGTNYWDSPESATITVMVTNRYPVVATNGASTLINGGGIKFLRVAEITNAFLQGPVSNMVVVVTGVRE